MSDYDSQSVFQPLIPKHLLTDKDHTILEAFSIDIIPEGDFIYLCANGSCTSACLHSEETGGVVELEEDDLFALFQEIIARSNGELPWVSMETAHTCNKMRPDGFGGSAVFITAVDVQYTGTSGWLTEKIVAIEDGEKLAPSQFCGEITVIDPNTKSQVLLEVHKDLASGAMFAIDSTFVDQVKEVIPSPFNTDSNIKLGAVPEDWKRFDKGTAAITMEILSEVEGVVTISGGIATMEDGTELFLTAPVLDEPLAVMPTIVNPSKEVDKAFAQICAVTAQACMSSKEAGDRIDSVAEILDGLATSAPAAKPIIGIIIDGGLVQFVVSNRPDLVQADVIVLDYDTDGADQDEIILVRQSNGHDMEAVGHREGITPTLIDLETTLANL